MDASVSEEALDTGVADRSFAWWERPYRIVQTNLRLTDANLDPEALAHQVKEFGATAITFNVGGIFAFYPTELPLQARNPMLTRDLTGDMLESAHREGLKMVGRYDLSKGTQIAYAAHPEWFVHNKDGEPQEYNATYQACVNGGWAQDYAHRILHESLSRYNLDGLFFNMTGYQPVDYSGKYRGICWCRTVRIGFAAMFQRRLPEREDFSDPAYADYLLFKERTSREASQRIYDTVKSLRPKAGVMGSGRGACDFMRLELQRAVKRPRPEWPHQAGELARWGAAYGTRQTLCLRLDQFPRLQLALLVGNRGSPHAPLRAADRERRADRLLSSRYVRAGQCRAARTGPHLHALACGERGAFRRHEVAGEGRALHSRATDLHTGATTTGGQHLNCFRGAYRMLLEARIPFDFVSDERMRDADAADVLSAYDVPASAKCRLPEHRRGRRAGCLRSRRRHPCRDWRDRTL
jgi:hypothetical protein